MMQSLSVPARRLWAEVSYLTGRGEIAQNLVIDIVVGRISKIVRKVESPAVPVEMQFPLVAVCGGPSAYEHVQGKIENKLQPVMRECLARGIVMSVSGTDSWDPRFDDMGEGEPAQVKVRLSRVQASGSTPN